MLFVPIMFFIMPETAGKDLLEIQKEFTKGNCWYPCSCLMEKTANVDEGEMTEMECLKTQQQ